MHCPGFYWATCSAVAEEEVAEVSVAVVLEAEASVDSVVEAAVVAAPAEDGNFLLKNRK
jgi:hypothetical protein